MSSSVEPSNSYLIIKDWNLKKTIELKTKSGFVKRKIFFVGLYNLKIDPESITYYFLHIKEKAKKRNFLVRCFLLAIAKISLKITKFRLCYALKFYKKNKEKISIDIDDKLLIKEILDINDLSQESFKRITGKTSQEMIKSVADLEVIAVTKKLFGPFSFVGGVQIKDMDSSGQVTEIVPSLISLENAQSPFDDGVPMDQWGSITE